VVLLAAGADHGGDHAINWWEIVALTINFLVLFLWLVPKVLKGLTGRTPFEHLADRRENLARQLREAQLKQEEAERRLAEYAKKLENLEQEVATIVAGYEAQGDADRKRLEEDAERAIERLVRETDFTIRQESLKAQKAIRQTAIDTTLRMAESMVGDRITESDQRRLADEYIHAVEQGPNRS